MVWLSLCLSLFLLHTVTVSDLLAPVIVNIDAYAIVKNAIATAIHADLIKPAATK